MGESARTVTVLLREWRGGDHAALDELMPLVYAELHKLAARYMRGETLIEAYWKSVAWPGQGLFIGEPLAAPFLAQPG